MVVRAGLADELIIPSRDRIPPPVLSRRRPISRCGSGFPALREVGWTAWRWRHGRKAGEEPARPQAAFDVQKMVDSDPPCPWGANGWRGSLFIGLSWAGDSEITSPWEECSVIEAICSKFYERRGRRRWVRRRSAAAAASPAVLGSGMTRAIWFMPMP